MSGALSAPSASPDHPPAQQAAAGYGPPAEPACTLQRVEQPTGYGCQQDQECSTSYEQECQTTYAQQCENVYEQKCETKERRQSLELSIVWRWPSHKSTFSFMFSRDMEEILNFDSFLQYEDKCSTTYEDQCKTEYDQELCHTIRTLGVNYLTIHLLWLIWGLLKVKRSLFIPDYTVNNKHSDLTRRN